jgi:uncharacterized protein (TIGR02145 family)
MEGTQMPRSKRAVRGTLILALVALLGSCQTTTVVEEDVPAPPPGNRLSAELAFAAGIAPDSVSWKLGVEKNLQEVQDVGADSLLRRRISLQVEYGPAKGDTLWVEFRRYGLRVSTMAWVRDGAGDPFTARLETIQRDTLARLILHKMFAAGIAGKTKADSVYASFLLDGKLEFNGFPDSVPGGMEPAKIRRLALAQAVERNLTLAQLSDAWVLDLTPGQARDSVRILVAAGLVPAADTSALVPPDRIRLTSALRIDSVVRPGDPAQSLKGRLLCEDGLQLLQVRILDDRGLDASASFAPQLARSLGGTEISLDTAGVLLQANGNAATGTYRLRLVVLDRKPRFDSFEISFQVEKLQVAKAPRITWVSPPKDTVLTTKDDAWLAKVRVEDALEIESVTIGGEKATKVGDLWQVLATIKAWGTPVSLTAKASNAAGRDSSVASPRITLNAPIGDALPEVVAVDPADGIDTVDFATSSRKISWKFAAGAQFKDVQVVLDPGNGAPVNLVAKEKDLVWSADIPLPATGKQSLVKVLVVTNSNYVVPVDTFWLTRSKDTAAPVIVSQAPPKVVNFDNLTVTLQWKVTDNHKVDTVKINGTRVMPQALGSDYYSYVLKLDTGTTKARVVVHDSTGNIAKDSVDVIRLHSSDPPRLVRKTGTTNRPIEYRSTDSYTVAWTVTDKELLDSVVIAGVTVKDADGLGSYSRTVAIGPGANRIGIQAWGKFSGKSAVDTVEITTVASDADLNKYNIQLMPDGRVWMTSNMRVTGGGCGIWGCELSGRVYTWSMAMGLSSAGDLKFTEYTPLSVVPGICPKGWHVAQAKEWSALYAATMPKGATDSALALRIDTGWGGTQGQNRWDNFLAANILFPEVTMTIGTGGIPIPKVTNRVRSMFWTPGESEPTMAQVVYAGASGTGVVSTEKPMPLGVRCIEDKKTVIRPIGVIIADHLIP